MMNSKVENPTCHPTLLLDNALRQVSEGEPRWNWTGFPECFWDCPIRPERDSAAKTENAIVIDCWKFGEELSSPCKSQIRYINDNELESWAKQPVPTQNDKLPRAGLRLLHICSDRLPFPTDILAAIENIFTLPHVELSTSTQNSGVCATLFDKSIKNPVFICRAPRAHIQKTAITTIVRYDPDSNITVGYVLSGSASEIHFTLKNVPTQFDICEHPLLIPVLMSEQFTGVLSNVMYGIQGRLYATEHISEGFTESPKPADRLYFRDTAHWLSNETRAYALCQAQMQACSLRNTFLEQQLESLDTWMPTNLLQSVQQSTWLLQQRIAYNRSNMEHVKVESGVEIRLEALKTLVSVIEMSNGLSFTKGDTPLKGLFNRVAQEDNLTNIKLSREMRQVAIKTKKDGSTMKLIAVLGTIFLPATFVSTFFSMPFFDWTAPTPTEVVGNHFWVYWAFTGPLTILTMILVGAWIVVRNRIISDGDDEAHQATSSNVDNGQQDSSKNSKTTTQSESSLHPEKNIVRHSGRVSDKLGDILESVLRLRSRQHNKTRRTGDEESRIR